MRRFFLVLSGCFAILVLPAQKPSSDHSGDVQQKLRKLSVLGTVLYVAAHPDDENTSAITYFANEKLLRTAYLSATRGDGGQNLIGPEIREGLGIIRTQELLAARRTDGGQQFFSRANDFGYSKHPDETLTIWDKEQVLSDFVRVFRQFKPDIVVTRFNINPGTTHGHHTTSAILAKEAFYMAADPEAFPEQLEQLEPWQPKKLFWNTSIWFFRGRGEKMDTANFVSLDLGTFNPNLGKSYTEISALSRSMHKSQGFGSIGSRGSQPEYFEQWEGEDTGDVFGGIDFTWDRVEGADLVKQFIELATKAYDPWDPQQTLNHLYNARIELMKLPDQFWKEVKLKEINEVVASITGLYLEVIADDYSYVPGDSITFKIEAIGRVEANLSLEDVYLEPFNQRQEIKQALNANENLSLDMISVVPDLEPTHPYWLNDQATLGMYHVEDNQNIGKPENDPVFTARFTLKWEDQFLEFEKPIVYKRRNPVDGEVYRPVVVSPSAMVNLGSEIMVFGNNDSKRIDARVIAGKSNASGSLQFQLPDGWSISPSEVKFDLKQKGEEALFSFVLKPPVEATEAELQAVLIMEDGTESRVGRSLISYDHIPVQTMYPPARTNLVKLDLKMSGNQIGYIIGAGDAIPENLRQIGYNVDILEKDDVLAENLKNYDAVILGIRAFNTVEWLSYKNQELFNYVREGGTVISQYNTTRGLVTADLAPYSMTLSRDRVAVENAEVRILEPNHPVLNYPNKITSKDFDNWVQERGLYFPSGWDENFTPLLSSNDPGEPERNGGLLVAQYGDGYYIYSGYSWFRELPAGVPGAYRLFVNLISIGKNQQQ